MKKEDKYQQDWWEYIILAIACLMIAFGLSSCKQIQYVPVEKVVTKDSIVIQKEYDSIEIKVKEYVAGDIQYRDSIVFRYILRTDTIYKNSRDSIPYTVEVVKEVERSRNWYEKTMIRIAWSFIAVVIGYILYKLIRWYIKMKG